METKNFYFKKDTGKLEITPFYDDFVEKPSKEKSKYNIAILTYDEWMKCSVCEYGKMWRYDIKTHEITYEDDLKLQATDEYKTYVRKNKISEDKKYLSDTDYVIAKLNELKLEDDSSSEQAKARYQDVLDKRKQCRNEINELEKE